MCNCFLRFVSEMQVLVFKTKQAMKQNRQGKYSMGTFLIF